MNKVAKYKIKGVAKSLKEGKSYSKALRDNNYSKGQASRGLAPKVIQEALKQNRAEFLKEDITPGYVIGNLREVRELAREKKDYSTMLQADIALGKVIALFTDKIQTKDTTITPQMEQELRNYISSNRLN